MLRYFRKDGHNWRKKKDGKTVKEAHEKLKVNISVDFSSLNISADSCNELETNFLVLLLIFLADNAIISQC